MYSDRVRLPLSEGTYTFLKGRQYPQPKEDKWNSNKSYTEALVIGEKEWDEIDDTEIFTPSEDVKIILTKEVGLSEYDEVIQFWKAVRCPIDPI